MTDRDRLQEVLADYERWADGAGKSALSFIENDAAASLAAEEAKRAAHNALTALALRELIAITDQGAECSYWQEGNLARYDPR
jgi:hypothetical protein